MILKDKIIDISDEILDRLLEFKEGNPDFTFSLRQRDSSTSGEERLSKGQWFIGSHYIFVPLFNRGDNKRKVKTIGFVLTFNKKSYEIENNYIEISFKPNNFKQSEIDFHTELANEFNMELNSANVGHYEYETPNDYLSNLDHYLNVFRPKALELLEKHNIKSGFIISEKKFKKSLETIMKFKSIINPIGDLEMIKEYYDLLKSKRQIILQGPPGTGKTYTAKDIAEYMISNSISSDKKEQKIKLEESDQFALVQFHPSYSYEDFVRGISAKNVGEKIVYNTENKILATFAQKAMDNETAKREALKLLNSSEEVSNSWQLEILKLKKYILIIDEINRANLPSVLGELIYALEYRDESVQSMYALNRDNSITLPENLYIIGTMNTADKSVGHIDYAIKRRFAFVDVLPNEDVIDHVKAKELFKKVASLFVKEENGIKSNSDYLAPDFDYKDVQLGHSYFILSDNSTGEEQKAELEMRLKYEILPILNDYVRDGLLLEIAKENIKEIAKFEC